MASDLGIAQMESQANEVAKIKSYKACDLPKDLRNLVIAPFLNSLRYGNDLFRLIDKDAYFYSYGKFVESLLKRPEAIIRLALLNDNTAIGWCLYENKVVHYLWVKQEVRRQGIGRSLLPKEFDTISHITNKGINVWVNKFPSVKFDPF